MALQHRDVASRRTVTTALPLYHSSQLKIRRRGDATAFVKHHAELRGDKFFLYPNETEHMYTEMFDLEGLKSMDVQWSHQKQSMPVYILKLRTETVKLKMPSTDAGEEWRSFILTVAKKQIPSDMKRLPGQTLQLQDILLKEKTRRLISVNPPLPARPPIPPRTALAPSPSEDSDLPSCFFQVSRQEAEELLESHPQYGSILIRPSSLVNSYAVTIRQRTSSGAVCRHYKVTQTSCGFVIGLETPVTVPSLNGVLEHFIQVTECRLSPFMSSLYNTHIESESSLTRVMTCQPQTEAQPQREDEKKSNISATLSSESNRVTSNTRDPIYENEHTPRVGFARRASNLSFPELQEELQEVLKLRQVDCTAFSDEDYSEWES